MRPRRSGWPEVRHSFLAPPAHPKQQGDGQTCKANTAQGLETASISLQSSICPTGENGSLSLEDLDCGERWGRASSSSSQVSLSHLLLPSHSSLVPELLGRVFVFIFVFCFLGFFLHRKPFPTCSQTAPEAALRDAWKHDSHQRGRKKEECGHQGRRNLGGEEARKQRGP